MTLGRTGELLLLAVYAAGSLLVGMLAAFLGFWAARFI